MTEQSDRQIAVIPRRNGEIRISLRHFEGREFADFRLYLVHTEGEKPLPTRKGLTISPSEWAPFMEAIGKLNETVKQLGWGEEENQDSSEN